MWFEAIGTVGGGMWMAIGLFYLFTGELPPPFDAIFGDGE